MKKFDNSKRGTILYTLCHWFAFNLTAIKLHHWRPKYLLHDLDKPFLMLWFRNDYTKVRNFHKEHNRHHLRYKGKKGFDWWAMMIDWECSHLTKTEKPWRAAETMEIQIKNYPKMEKEIREHITPILIKTGLLKEKKGA